MGITVKITRTKSSKIQRIHPVCRSADLFCKLMGKKSFSISDLLTIKELGYSITTTGMALCDLRIYV